MSARALSPIMSLRRDWANGRSNSSENSGVVYTCDALIIATGAKAKWLEIPSEEKFKGYGVSACATCDGFFFRGRKVLVVGGGNTAIEEALYLSNIASHVTLVHRRDRLRGERVLHERLASRDNVDVLYDHAIDEIIGVEDPLTVTNVRLKNVKTGARQMLDVDGVFIAIGHKPASELFVGQLALKQGGYIEVEAGTTLTSLPGVFAAGDVADDTLSPSRDGGRTGLHGRARSGALPARRSAAHRRDGIRVGRRGLNDRAHGLSKEIHACRSRGWENLLLVRLRTKRDAALLRRFA